MRRIIAYYAVSVLMAIYFEWAVLRYQFQASRPAALQIEHQSMSR